ncbi:hypothetical protein B0H12DRAFT_1106998 [Mycena haematopus]|nr:hypothetical protein B0H12DRAFT_1106998 [Mycena haematopus]
MYTTDVHEMIASLSSFTLLASHSARLASSPRLSSQEITSELRHFKHKSVPLTTVYLGGIYVAGNRLLLYEEVSQLA